MTTEPRVGPALLLSAAAALTATSCGRDGQDPSPAQQPTSSADLVAALRRLQPHVIEHGLETTSGPLGPAPLEGADSAAADPEAESAFISTGMGSATGLGDTDFAGDEEPDVTSFWMRLQVPDGMSSLRLRTRFVSAEVDGSGGFREDDRAELAITFPLGAVTLVSLGRCSESYEPECPARSHVISVEQGSVLRLEFMVREEADGSVDSGLHGALRARRERPHHLGGLRREPASRGHL